MKYPKLQEYSGTIAVLRNYKNVQELKEYPGTTGVFGNYIFDLVF